MDNATKYYRQLELFKKKIKIILCLNRPKAIGFICRNTDGNRRKDQYVNTLRDVERLTGMHFFPSLDPDIRSAIESHADIDEW